VSLSLKNLYSLESIEGDEITFLMENIVQKGDDFVGGNKTISWTFNAEDIYVLNAYEDDVEKSSYTTFWMDKYPHKEEIKKNLESESFINNKVLGGSFKNLLPPAMVDKVKDLMDLLGDSENDNEQFECDTLEDSDIFFLLENYFLESKGHLSLGDVYVPLALD